MRYRRLLFGVLTTALVVVAVIAGGEIVARLLGAGPDRSKPAGLPWSEPHPVLGWTNREGRYPSDDPGHAMMTFGAGGRRASHPEEPPAEEPALRVALVGGSWFQGFGVADEETFAWKAGEILPSARFENLASGGYGTLQSLQRFEEAAREGERFDLLVYGFASFHPMRNVATYEWSSGLRRRSGERLSPPRAAIEDRRIVRHPPYTLPEWPLERSSALVSALHDRAFEVAFRGRDEQAVEVTQRLLWQMKLTAEHFGGRLLVMVIYGFDELDPYVIDMRKRGIAIADCRYPEDPRQPQLRVGGSGHPNAIVHAHWARCLARVIEGGFEAQLSGSRESGGAGLEEPGDTGSR